MPLPPSMKQMEDSLATTSCRPLGAAAVDMGFGSPGGNR
jgi:hypothetical protein